MAMTHGDSREGETMSEDEKPYTGQFSQQPRIPTCLCSNINRPFQHDADCPQYEAPTPSQPSPCICPPLEEIIDKGFRKDCPIHGIEPSPETVEEELDCTCPREEQLNQIIAVDPTCPVHSQPDTVEERLRSRMVASLTGNIPDYPDPLCIEAADTILAQRREIERYRSAVPADFLNKIEQAKIENKRLDEINAILNTSLGTEQTMHKAWRKRAEEAEAENAKLREALEKIASALPDDAIYRTAWNMVVALQEIARAALSGDKG